MLESPNQEPQDRQQELALNEYLLRQPIREQVNLMLHPRKTGESIPASELTLRKVLPLVEQKELSFFIQFIDERTGFTYLGKLLRPGDDGFRHQTFRHERLQSLMHYTERNLRFAPDGLVIGVYPILPSNPNENQCIFGPKLKIGEIPDPRFEYISLMHHLSSEEFLNRKIPRNPGIIRATALAVHDVHRRADEITLQEAWRFGGLEALQYRFAQDQMGFLQILDIIKDQMPKDTFKQLWSDTDQKRLLLLWSTYMQNEFFRRIVDRRIEQGAIKRGHGDLTGANMVDSDLYRAKRIYYRKDELFPVDAVDFNDLFPTQDELAEMSMLYVDMQGSCPVGDAAMFLRSYLINGKHIVKGQLKTPEIVFLLPVFFAQKSMARTIVAGDQDKNYPLCKRFIEVTARNLKLLEGTAERLAAVS